MGKDNRRYKDRREYLIKAVYARRKKVRKMAVVHKGGKCEKCGYDRCIEALEFHHVVPTQKDFNISSKGYNRSWERVKVELDKCIMLCANCHREFHTQVSSLPWKRGSEKRAKSGKPRSFHIAKQDETTGAILS